MSKQGLEYDPDSPGARVDRITEILEAKKDVVFMTDEEKRFLHRHGAILPKVRKIS